MYTQQYLTTKRLTTAYYRAGEGNTRKLLLVHGNVSSSVFYLPLLPALSAQFDVVAADLRCFGDSDALPVDATRGFRDWTDDLAQFTAALGWDRFAIAGWSMGGCVATAGRHSLLGLHWLLITGCLLSISSISQLNFP